MSFHDRVSFQSGKPLDSSTESRSRGTVWGESIDPIESFHLQLQEEVEAYERLKRGEFAELDDLRAVGHLLITSRIAQGISQRELARRLGVHESQVSRDERNEYFGITLERAAKILDVLNVRLHTKIAIEPLPPAPVAQAS